MLAYRHTQSHRQACILSATPPVGGAFLKYINNCGYEDNFNVGPIKIFLGYSNCRPIILSVTVT